MPTKYLVKCVETPKQQENGLFSLYGYLAGRDHLSFKIYCNVNEHILPMIESKSKREEIIALLTEVELPVGKQKIDFLPNTCILVEINLKSREELAREKLKEIDPNDKEQVLKASEEIKEILENQIYSIKFLKSNLSFEIFKVK